MPRPDLSKLKPLEGFKRFIGQYGVLSLALGVAIGSAVNDLVKAVVDDLVTPFISLITPEGKLQHFSVVFHGATFQIGAVVTALITFLVIAGTVYFTVKVILRNEELLEKK